MKTFPKMTFLALVMVLLCTTVTAEEPPAKVMLLGTFHFANPQKDLIKTDQINVMTEENQRYIETISRKLADFRPTHVLLEFKPNRSAEMNKRYSSYRAGEYELPANETYQLGFRVAKLAGLKQVHGFDHRGIHWQASAMFEEMQKNDPEIHAELQTKIAEVGQKIEKMHSDLTLEQMMLFNNTDEADSENMGFYLMTNEYGAGDSFSGADAAASWWHRNFRMYGLLQQHAQPGTRVLAIGGQGHTAILKQLLELDPVRESVDVTPYLKTSQQLE